jgi:WD40 repeat protein
VADRNLTVEAEVNAVGFSPDGSLAAICRDGKLRILDPQSGAVRSSLAWEKTDASPTLANPEFATIANDGAVKLWDVKESRLRRRVATVPQRSRQVAISADQTLIATSSLTPDGRSEQTLYVWDIAGLRRVAVPAGLGGTSAIAFSPDGATVAAASYDANVRVFSTRNGELLRLIDEVLVATFAMQFSPDGRYLATAGADRTLYLWDAKTWKLARKLTGQPELISALAFSKDGRYLATGGFNEITVRHPVSVLLWDTASGKVLRKLPAPHRVNSVAFAPDHTALAAAWGEKTIGLFSVPA